MTGEAEFNEVYFTDVRIPDAERLGDVGEGWRVAMTTLMNERVAIGGRSPPPQLGRRSLRRSASVAGARRTVDPDAPRPADAALDPGRGPAPHQPAGRADALGGHPRTGGLGRQAGVAELNKDIYELCLDLLGPDGMLYGSYEMTRPGRTADVHATTRRSRSCGPGPTRSRAAPRRSCATSSASGCSACPATSASTRTSPGARCPAADGQRRWPVSLSVTIDLAPSGRPAPGSRSCSPGRRTSASPGRASPTGRR